VQLARLAGAHVIATASVRNRAFLCELGASTVIDYTTTRFEDVVKPVDVVFDLVGGDTLQRSWQVMKPGGMLVSVVSPRPAAEIVQGHEAHFAWFVVEPNREQLIQIGTLLDAGYIRPIVETVLPLSEVRQAYEQAAKGHIRGKIVLRVVDG
jgi:NADPH:quinone reductase-like Zn-dependent oxidoreductase